MRSDVVRAFVEQSNAPTCRVHPSWAPSYVLPSLRQVLFRYRSRTSHAETLSRSAWFAFVRGQRSFLTLSDTSHSPASTTGPSVVLRPCARMRAQNPRLTVNGKEKVKATLRHLRQPWRRRNPSFRHGQVTLLF